MKIFGKAFNSAIDAMACLSLFLIVFINLTIICQVLMRLLYKGTIIWANDATEYTILWLAFLGGPYVLREQKHIAVDIVVDRLSPRNQLMVKTITSYVGAGICLVISWYALVIVWDFYQRGLPVIKTIEVPKALVLFPIFLGSFFMMIQFFLNARKIMLKRKNVP